MNIAQPSVLVRDIEEMVGIVRFESAASDEKFE